MADRPLSDADIDALVTGTSTARAPETLVELVASLRRHGDHTPPPPASPALREFMVAPDLTAPAVDGALLDLGARRWHTRVAAAVAMVPVPLVVGVTVAAAAVGGAQGIGMIDVPVLPARPAAIEVPRPVEPGLPLGVPPVEVPVIEVPSPTPAPAPTTGKVPTSLDVPSTVHDRPSNIPDPATAPGGLPAGQPTTPAITGPPSPATPPASPPNSALPPPAASVAPTLPTMPSIPSPADDAPRDERPPQEILVPGRTPADD